MTHHIALAGDWHGNTRWAASCIREAASHDVHEMYQLGDFGLGWPSGWNQYINEVIGACVKHDMFLSIIPGNHENYDWIRALHENQDGPNEPAWILDDLIRVLPRGYREKLPHNRTMVALGGAPSIDFRMRSEGRSWWPAEQITLEEAEAVAAAGHADIMLTHDAPDGGTMAVQRIVDDPSGWKFWGHAGINYAREGRELMNIAFQGVRPKVFAHGHMHVADFRDDGVTQFLSLAGDGTYGNLALLDLYTLESKWVF